MRKGCSTFGARDALPGFDALLCRKRAVQALYGGGLPGDGPAHRGEVGSRRLRGASPRPCSRSPHSRTRRPPSRGHAPWTHVGRVCGVSTVCTRPLPASTPICALYPKCQFLPFLDFRAPGCRVRGPCSSWSSGPSMKVASTMEPPRIMIRQFLELGVEIAEYGPAESLPLEDMAELREGRRVRHLFLHEVEVHEALHRPRVRRHPRCPRRKGRTSPGAGTS